MGNQSDGSSPPLSLPSGGGAVRGIGETFQANLFNGTGTFSIPIVVSPGRDGLGPGLALEYSAGHGNGPFGLGWRLSLPSVTRKTEKGLPRYDGSDVFMLSGAEDLVRALRAVAGPAGADGRWEPLEPVSRGEYTVTLYRPRTEGLFARVEHWESSTDKEVHWRAVTRDNVTSVYGRTTAARILATPADGGQTRVFEWLLEETYDARGNHILYEYAEESGPDRPEVYEAGREYHQRYLRRILYGNSHAPVGPERTGPDHRVLPDSVRGVAGFPPLPRRYLFEVLFDYGDLAQVWHAAGAQTPLASPLVAGAVPTGDWELVLNPELYVAPGAGKPRLIDRIDDVMLVLTTSGQVTW